MGYLKVLLEERTVFFFSVENLLWKTNMFFWKSKNSKKCFFWETHMSYSEKISRCLRYVKLLLEVRRVFFFSVETLIWKIITFFWKVKISGNTFVRNAHVLLRNVKTLFAIFQRIVRRENSVPFPCRSFNLKDNHVLWKGYEFHEMVLWETHMCYSEKISCFLRYV